jgi:archaemetzincin
LKNIYILPLGEIDQEILAAIKTELTIVFQIPTKVLAMVSNPAYAFEPKRCQYYSTKILKQLINQLPADGSRILGITEVDLCTPVLTFVFGEAHLEGVAAIISLARLRQEYYQLPANETLLLNRAVKEAIHELGHTVGLVHCDDTECVMCFSPNVLSVDQKRNNFCPICEEILSNRLEEIRKQGG